MKSLLFSKLNGSASTSAVNYSFISGQVVSVPPTENTRQQVIGSAGTFSKFRIKLVTAPGSGKSYNFTVRKNGVDTAVTVTISNTDTIGADTSNSFTVAAGDLISIKITPSGTPTAPGKVATCIQFEGDVAKESLLLAGLGGNTLGAANTTYYLSVGAFAGASSNTSEASTQIVCAVAGTLKKLYVDINTAPGAGKTRVFTLRKNGADTALTCTISNTGLVASDTGHTVSVNAGDLLSLKCVGTGTPASTANVKISVTLEATNDGYFSEGSISPSPSTSVTNYMSLASGNALASASTTENQHDMVSNNMVISGFYVNLGTAPASGKSYTHTIRKNGSDTSKVAVVSNTNTTANDTSHNVSVTDGDLISVSIVPAGTPTASSFTRVSMAGYVKLEIPITKSLKYTVLKTYSAITKSLKYDVSTATPTPISVTKSLKYAVRKTITAITKSLTYRIVVSHEMSPVRRPNQISGLVAWYDASQLTGLSDGDNVTSFTDLSGNGFHATTNGYFNPPTYQTNELNGLPVLRFVAASSQALRSFPTTPTGNNAWTAFVVARLTGGANQRVLGSIYPTYRNWLLGWWNGNQDVAYYEGFINNVGTPDTNWKQYTGKGNGSSTGYLYSSGSLLYSAGYYSSPNGGLAFSGYDPAGTNELSNCEIAEVILYSGALSDTDREEVEAYLNNKYFGSALSNQYQLKYAIKRNVVVTKSLKYVVHITQSAITKSLKYAINITPSGITKSLTYKIADSNAITKSLTYTVRSVVSAITKSLKYTVLYNPSAVTKSLTYKIKTTPSITKSLTYKVAYDSVIQKSLSYFILKTPSAITKSLKYSINVVISAITKSLTYKVLSTPSAIQKTLVYKIRLVPSGITKSLAYLVKTEGLITKSLTYEVVIPITQEVITKSLAYLVVKSVAITKSLSYHVEVQNAITKQLKYSVADPSVITKSLKYTVEITPSSIQKSLAYFVVRNSSITKSLSYEIKISASITKSLKYVVSSPISLTKNLIYKVKAQKQITKSLRYSVIYSPSGISKSLTYEVVVPLSIQKSLHYEIRKENAITKSLTYVVVVITVENIEKSLAYKVKKSISISKSLTYTVLGGYSKNNKYSRNNLYSKNGNGYSRTVPSNYAKTKLYTRR